MDYLFSMVIKCPPLVWGKNLRTKKRIKILSTFYVAWDQRRVLLVVRSSTDYRKGDILMLKTPHYGVDNFAVIQRNSQYSKLVVEQGIALEDQLDPALNLQFEVIEAKLMNNLELIEYENNRRNSRSKKRSRKSKN